MYTDDKNNIFCVVSLGCKVNKAEIDEYSALLIASGWKQDSIKNSNLLVINTCTVTSIADKKSRKIIRKCCMDCSVSSALILVTGCCSAVNKDFFLKLDSRIRVIPKKSMLSFLKDNLCQISNWKSMNSKVANILSNNSFRTRQSIKIQDGCNNSCTYCIVCFARGKSVSLNYETVIDKFTALLNSGVKEIVLTGVNIGAYSFGGWDLNKLCKHLVKCIKDKFSHLCSEGIVPARIRISSIEPQDVSTSLIDTIANSNGLICRHMHLPLQSGSSKVLSDMNRKYNIEQYANLVYSVKDSIPDISLTTDIIVGFPGESDSDFLQTMQNCKQFGFMNMHVFPYSKRDGTLAAKRQDQVAHEIKKQRAFELRKLSEQLKSQDLARRKGKFEYVLFEDTGSVRTESYHLIKVSKQSNVGNLMKIRL